MLNKNRFAELIATFFYVGKIKYCPGTFGSLVSFPLYYIIVYFIRLNQVVFSSSTDIIEQQVFSAFFIIIFTCVVLFIIGTYFTSVYVQYTGVGDPKEVVIDEVVGQMLTIALCSFSVEFAHYSKIAEYLSNEMIEFIFLAVMPFCLFRFFDIRKPWPINWCDQNIHGGFGVMFDDILAAIFAAVAHYAIFFCLINWL
jgi:phosphatidylglycerophosphatase A